MNMIKSALRKPITILVLVVGLLIFGIKATKEIRVDILPEMNLPVVYIAHSFGGYTPSQMEGYFTKMYINMMLFANGIQNIETKNTQGLTLMKVTFYPDTDMGQAIAEISALSNRSQVFLPPGAPPPFIIRFDASSQAIGQLVFKSETKNQNELQDIANFTARPFLVAIPGLTSAPPFGGSPRSIEINVDPTALRVHNMSPDQIVEAITKNNITAPGGNVQIGDVNYLTPTNNVLKTLNDFENIPLYKGDVQTVYLRDVATVKDGADITTGYALVDGKRSVYINIAKSGKASTWDVVKKLKETIPTIQNNLPEGVSISYEFDQSVYVISAVKTLIAEGIIGAFLTGLMVFLFLRDRRSALIVILTIPVSLISGVLFLKLFGHTINIMSLSGLALAVGILVDESTVTIENIHQHLEMGKKKATAIWEACKQIAFAKLLILLCVLAAFVPALTMDGIPGALFQPLALAIGFSMITSFILSQTFVPVMANWLIKEEDLAKRHGKVDVFDRFKTKVMGLLNRLFPSRKAITLTYLVATLLIVGGLFTLVGTDVFPNVNSSQFQVRIKAKEGTRIESTEQKVHQVLAEIEEMVGKEHIKITSAFIGQHPSTFAVSPIYLYNAGPHEATLQVAFNDNKLNLDKFKDDMRAKLAETMPDVSISFEPIELTEKVLSQGATNPIEVRFSGMMKKRNEMYANKLLAKLKEYDYMRDQQIPQSLNYPILNIDVDRVRAGQLGVEMADITKSLVASTSSSRYTSKNFWVGGMMGMAYDIQVQVPINKMTSVDDLSTIPVSKGNIRPILSDVATITEGKGYGESYNKGTMGYTSVVANIHQTDLGRAQKDVRKAIDELGEIPKGLNIEVSGMTPVLEETQSSLASGLLIAIAVIFLLLAANFQSFKVSAVILTTIPAVIMGALTLLLITGSTLNLQSYMGIIMSIGVSIANALLLVTNAEDIRKTSQDSIYAAKEAAGLRIRPILMTSFAMIAGMLPMAIGFGEGGEQTAPLGRAVIGGLITSTLVVILILPQIFAWVQGRSNTKSISLDPEDKDSAFYDNKYDLQ